LIAVGGNFLGGEYGSLFGSLRVFGEFVWHGCTRIHRIDEHLQRDILLELFPQHEVHELFGERTVLSPFEDADKLDLAKAGIGSQNGCSGCVSAFP
jgi:hypothetical protein